MSESNMVLSTIMRCRCFVFFIADKMKGPAGNRKARQPGRPQCLLKPKLFLGKGFAIDHLIEGIDILHKII